MTKTIARPHQPGMLRAWTAAGFLALTLGAATLAHARNQGTETPAPAAEDQAPAVKVERGAGGKKVYRIQEEIRIEGKIQKPEAFYVLQKSSINYDWQELKQQFIPRILDSVKKTPF